MPPPRPSRLAARSQPSRITRAHSPVPSARKTLRSPSTYSTSSSSSSKSSVKPKARDVSRTRKSNSRTRSVKRPRVQFAPQEDAATLTSLGSKSGYLKKKELAGNDDEEPEHEWEWYYCVIRPAKFLYYYRSEEDAQPCGIVDMEYLRSIKKKGSVDRKEKAAFIGGGKHSFRLALEEEDRRVTEDVYEHLQSNEEDAMEMYFDPPDAGEADEWMDALLKRQDSDPSNEDNDELMNKLMEADDELEKVRKQLEDADRERHETVISFQQDLVESTDLVGELQQGAEMLADEAEEIYERCREMLENVTGREYARLSLSVREQNGANEGVTVAIRTMGEMFAEAIQEVEQHEEMLVGLREQEQALTEQIKKSKGGSSRHQKEQQKQLEAMLLKKDQEMTLMNQELEKIRTQLQGCQQVLADKERLITDLQKRSVFDAGSTRRGNKKRSERNGLRDDASDVSGKNSFDSDSWQKNGAASAKQLQTSKSAYSARKARTLSGNKQSTSAATQQVDNNSRSVAKSSRFAGALTSMSSRVLSKNSNESSRSHDDDDTHGTCSSRGSAPLSDDEGDTCTGWSRLESRRYPGEYYYHNNETGENSWTNPAKRDNPSHAKKTDPPHRTPKRAHQLPPPPKEEKRNRDRPVKSVINLEASPFVVRKTSRAKKNKPPIEEFVDSDPGSDHHPDSSDYDSDAIADSHAQTPSAPATGKFNAFRWKKSILPKNTNLVKSITSSRKFPSWKKKKKAVEEPQDFEMSYGTNRHEF